VPSRDRADEAIPEGLRFHDLRHTCAAVLIANGCHMEEIKDHLGHSSIRVTSDRYGRLFRAAGRLWQKVSKGCSSTRHDNALKLRQTQDGRSSRLCPRSTPKRTRFRSMTWAFFGADDGIRTRDPHLGKVMLYQLSHVRLLQGDSSNGAAPPICPASGAPPGRRRGRCAG
jgi:hypothetical protein